MSVYNTSQPLQREQFLTRAKFLADKGCVIEIRERRPQRTYKQNAYLHTLLAYFGCQIGETLDYVKTNYYKIECNSDLFCVTVYDKVLKKEVRRLRSSASLSTDEMTTSIERFRNWSSAQCGIYLPSPTDHYAMVELEREIERNQKFL